MIERGEVDEYITPDCSYCKKNTASWCGIFEAWPKLMAFPVDYQWCLCGQVLEEGEGEVSTSNGPIEYCLSGRRLKIETELGQDIDCELCVSAIDARGQELFTCIKVSKSGVETRCRKCEPTKGIRFDYLPIVATLNTWRPLLPHKTDRPGELSIF